MFFRRYSGIFCFLALVGLFWTSQYNAAAEPIIHNADFRNEAAWWQTSNASIKELDGRGIITPEPGKTATLIQTGLRLEKDHEYILNYEFRAGKEAKIRIYVEWTDNNIYHSSRSLEFQSGNEQWCKKNFRFIYTGSTAAKNYIVIQASGGTVSIYNLSLTLVGNSRIPSPTTGGYWLKNNDITVSEQNGEPCISVKKGSLLLKSVPTTNAGHYRFEFNLNAAGDSGTASGYHPFRVGVVMNGNTTWAPWDDILNAVPQRKNFEFDVPAQVKLLDFILEVNTNGTLTVTKPELKLSPRKNDETLRVEITEPFYRQTIYKSLPTSYIAGILTESGTFSALGSELCDSSGKIIGKASGTKFTFPASALPPGEYFVVGRWHSAVGKEFRAESKVVVAAPAPREVVVGPDRQLYINGKLFWPIVFFQYPGSEQQRKAFWSEMAAAGVNTLLLEHVNDANIENLNLANECGLKLMISMGSIGRPGTENETLYAAKLDALLKPDFVNHPALLGYFLYDEPSWGGAPLTPLVRSYEMLRKRDLFHPIWINAAPRGDIAEHQAYSRACDIYGVDIYPVPAPDPHGDLPNKTLSVVGDYAAKMTTAVGGQKPNWMILQAFAWGVLNNRPPVYPTRKELRFMACDALLNGGTAIVFWGQVAIRDPNFYRRLLEFTHELHRFSGLAAGKPCDGFSTKCKDLELLGIEVGKQKFLIAANRSGNTLHAEIMTPFAGEGLHVIGENRTLPLKGSMLIDEIEGFDVRIYSPGPLPAPLYPLPEWHGQGYSNWQDALSAPEACWIWKRNRIASGSRVGLFREIFIGKPVREASLAVGVDDFGTAYLNGKLLGKTGAFNCLRRFQNITLSPGRNILAVDASDGGGLPCGMIAKIQIKYADGTTDVIYSDDSWFAADSWKADPKTWEKAAVVAPLGGPPYANIWGNKIPVSE